MDNTEMISVNNEEVSMSLSEYEKKMLEYIEYLGLPTNGILVPIDERKK